MAIDMDAVKELRHRSGAGVLDCKRLYKNAMETSIKQ